MATQETRTSIRWDYAPAPESPDHVRLRDSYGLFIDGDFADPGDGTRVPSEGSRKSPSTKSPYESRSRTWSGDSGAGA